MKFLEHKVNFKHCGAWYEMDDGRGLYLAHRQMRHIYKKRNAWCIERIALEDTIEKGYTGAGVVVKQGKRKLVWLTDVTDFFGPHSFSNPDNILQRCLPLNRFRIIPAMNMGNVEAAMKLR
jgi:hypothetical protein